MGGKRLNVVRWPTLNLYIFTSTKGYLNNPPTEMSLEDSLLTCSSSMNILYPVYKYVELTSS